MGTKFRLMKYLINNNLVVPPSKITNLSPQNFTYLKWKYSKEIKYEKCPEKKQLAINNLNDLLGEYTPSKYKL